MPRYIYSDSLEEMVVKGFTYHNRHYTWYDPDILYYDDDTEEYAYFEIPEDAVLDGENSRRKAVNR